MRPDAFQQAPQLGLKDHNEAEGGHQDSLFEDPVDEFQLEYAANDEHGHGNDQQAAQQLVGLSSADEGQDGVEQEGDQQDLNCGAKVELTCEVLKLFHESRLSPAPTVFQSTYAPSSLNAASPRMIATSSAF